jgi:predicted phosphodiesterase
VSEDLSDFLAVSNTAPKASAPKPGEPSIEWDGQRGVISTGQVEAEPEPKAWRDLIADWGLNPDDVEIIPGSVQIRAWDANVGQGEIKRLRYYRASIVARTANAEQRADLEDLKRALMRRKPLRPSTNGKKLSSTRIICIGDPQIGKEGTTERLPLIVASIEHAITRAKSAERIILVNAGDTVEGCLSNYAAQAFTVELDNREQEQVARRLWLRAIDHAARHAPVDVLAVPSNHGERRNGDGKAYTRTSDNADLAIMDQVADVVHSTDRYPDVRFGFPPDDDPLVVTTEVDGINIAVHHSHITERGATPEQKMLNWIKGQSLGRLPAGWADILISGHNHHAIVSEVGGRVAWFQTPALDAGSRWYRDRTGLDSPAGVMSWSVGDFGDRCWGDLHIDS